MGDDRTAPVLQEEMGDVMMLTYFARDSPMHLPVAKNLLLIVRPDHLGCLYSKAGALARQVACSSDRCLGSPDANRRPTHLHTIVIVVAYVVVIGIVSVAGVVVIEVIIVLAHPSC